MCIRDRLSCFGLLIKIPISACLVLKSSSLSSNISSTSISGFNCINSCILGVSQVVPKLTTVVTDNFPDGLCFLSPKVVSTSFNLEITS